MFQAVSKNWMPLLPSRTPTGHKYYSAIHVDDLVQALSQMLSIPDENFKTGERYFVSDGQIYTYERILSIIASEMKIEPIKFRVPNALITAIAGAGSLATKILKINFPINRDRLSEIHADYWICSPEKINALIAFKPKYTMESGVAQTLGWYKINGWL